MSSGPAGEPRAGHNGNHGAYQAEGGQCVLEALQDLVPAGGAIGIMSAGQGSISDNENGRHEVYRGSKAALQYRDYLGRTVPW